MRENYIFEEANGIDSTNKASKLPGAASALNSENNCMYVGRVPLSLVRSGYYYMQNDQELPSAATISLAVNDDHQTPSATRL